MYYAYILKSGSGKTFAYKRLAPVALGEDVPKKLEKSILKSKTKDT